MIFENTPQIHLATENRGKIAEFEEAFSDYAIKWYGLGDFPPQVVEENGLIQVEALKEVRDSTIAMAGALLLFVIPSNFRQRKFLLDWETAVKIPWEIIILFGGGFALAYGISESGLSNWVVERLLALQGVFMLGNSVTGS